MTAVEHVASNSPVDGSPTAAFAAIRQREAAATAGPWSWRGNVDYQDPWLAARVPEVGMCEVLGTVTVERTRDDRAIVNSMLDVNPEDEEFVLNAYLYDAYGEPRKDQHLCFNTDQMLIDARKLVQFEVAPSAADREDPRVYRADINAIRHPDAEFIAHSRQDVTDLLAAVDRVAALHVLVEYASKQSGHYWSACQACGHESDDLTTDPCPTLAALRGDS